MFCLGKCDKIITLCNYIEERGWVNDQILLTNCQYIEKFGLGGINNLQVYTVQFLICLFKLSSIIYHLAWVITAAVFFLQCEAPV